MADLPLMVHRVTHIMEHSILVNRELGNHVLLLLEFVDSDALQDRVIILILAIDVARTIRLKAQMLQQRPLMYYIIVTQVNLNFALRGDRTALCSYEYSLLSFLAALSILLVLVCRDFFRNDHRHNVRLPLLFGVQFLILGIFHHSYRVVLLPNVVIIVVFRCGSILADISFFQIAFVGLESFTRVSLILTSQLERVLT